VIIGKSEKGIISVNPTIPADVENKYTSLSHILHI